MKKTLKHALLLLAGLACFSSIAMASGFGNTLGIVVHSTVKYESDARINGTFSPDALGAYQTKLYTWSEAKSLCQPGTAAYNHCVLDIYVEPANSPKIYVGYALVDFDAETISVESNTSSGFKITNRGTRVTLSKA